MEITELSTFAIAIMAVAIVLASMITSITGMAGGLLMFAAMNVFLPLRPLVAIHGAVQVMNNAARTWFLRGDVRWQMCIPFSLGAVIGAVLTTLFLAEVVGEFFPLLILTGLVFYTLFKPRRLPQIRLRDGQFFWVGIATGTMGIIIGVVDPLLAVFFMRDDLSKEEVVSNKSMMQMVTHLTKIPAYLFLGFSFIDNAALILVLGLAGVVGAKLGVLVLRRMEIRFFFLLMKAALMIAAVRLLFQLIELA
ncbi:sulfite exporter TauE/SafE family protein [Pseudomaricurvus alkylphenolicus]|jgi:uncharacterized membrane protein YfcA|uniref:sulfite exporter TauE/SafE family protein n=1 Tax=Pseudomaricurvus alkylphenolicus TaxID=1306991 RepID=UPI00141EB513|nr:sulfite exporter TauE/SafE family protein [Pseudomaricurvus alkylphenolicus]NIB42792.1 sulfite exporter TauE/SafE family protein [Pseudomaricurvus alkylphenolicus]